MSAMDRRSVCRLLGSLVILPRSLGLGSPQRIRRDPRCEVEIDVRQPRKTDPEQSAIRVALREAAQLLEVDGLCGCWLDVDQTTKYVKELIEYEYFGHGEFWDPTTKRRIPRVSAIAGSGCTNLPPGFALTINRRGAFFVSSYESGAYHLGTSLVPGYRGGSREARLSIIYHELPHLRIVRGFPPDAGDPAMVEANSRLVRVLCDRAMEAGAKRD